jgi:hypothetical protein
MESRPKLKLKNRLYEAVYDLQRGFGLLQEVYDRLLRLAVFRRDYLHAFHTMLEELRARTNCELTEALRDRETRDSAHLGRLRRKWERRFQAPDDTAQTKPATAKPHRS